MSINSFSAGQSGGTIRGIINANAAELDNGRRVVTTGRRPIIATAGDSIANMLIQPDMTAAGALHYCLQALNPLEFVVDFRTGNADGSGGYNFGIGGSPSSFLNTDWAGNTAAITRIAAKTVKPDIVFVQTIQNDAMTWADVDNATINGYVNNVTTFAQSALNQGVQLVVLCPRPPYNGQVSATVPRNHAHVNQRLAAFAAATPGVVFMNYLPDVKAISDANENNGASSVVAWRGSAATGQWTNDGVHPSTLSVRAIAVHIQRILAPFTRRAVPRANTFGAYDPTTYLWNNIYGRDGMMVGTQGQYNGVLNANVAGSSSGATTTRWTLTDGNGIVATPSIITHADGYARQRLTLSGTATAAATVQLSLAFIQDVASAPFAFEAMLDFTSVNGLQQWDMYFGGSTYQTGQNVSQVGALNDKLFLRSLYDVTFSNSGFSNKQAALVLQFANGSTASGTVDLGRVGGWKLA